MDGVLNVLKPAGMTSFDVVACLRRVYGQKKIGHGGTLDPIAAGVLPVFLGRAARLIEYMPLHRKTYEGEFLMGLATDTEDATGRVIERGAPQPDRAVWESAAQRFRGRIAQVPPAFSAKQVGGRRAYDIARAGGEVALAPKDVDIYDLTIREAAPPFLRLSVTCSSGTYVRALGRDLGRAAGCPLTMSFLLRTAMGPFAIGDAKTLEEIEADPAGSLMADVRALLPHLPGVELKEGEGRAFLQGKALAGPWTDADTVAVTAPQGFLGIASVEEGLLHPKKVFPPEGPSR